MAEPLVPAEVDLRDFDFMPLEVRLLRDSSLASAFGKNAGEEFRAAVLLWCAAWHQLPASSLPDDDGELSTLSGYGRAVKEWGKVKVGALRGWVKCSDGRLYHPVVAEKAITAWHSKLDNAHKKACDRIRKENHHRKEKGLPLLDVPTFAAWNSSRSSSGIPPERDADSIGIPAENVLKGKGSKGEGEVKGSFNEPEELHGESSAVDNSQQPSSDKSETANPKVNGKKYATPGWWKSDQSVLAKGKEVGINPIPGEKMQAFKQRIFDKLNHGKSKPTAS
jgi:hypothetical protein